MILLPAGPLLNQMRAEELSLRQMAAELVSKGIRTPRGGEWTGTAVRNALTVSVISAGHRPLGFPGTGGEEASAPADICLAAQEGERAAAACCARLASAAASISAGIVVYLG